MRSVKLDATWNIGELIELSGDLRDGARLLDAPYPPVTIRELDLHPMAEGWEYLPYTQEMHLSVQSSTYLETAAHLFPEREKIGDIGLERLFPSTVVLQIPRGPNEKVTAPDIESALERAQEQISPGDALLIATGYDRFSEPSGDRSPRFRYDAVEWVVQHGCSILGSDMSNWQDPDEKPSFFPMFFRSQTLLLAPMVHLNAVPATRIQMIVMPLRIEGACASPCRVVGILPPGIQPTSSV
jgi:arylformamidase